MGDETRGATGAPTDPIQAHVRALDARRTGDVVQAIELFRLAASADNEDVATAAQHNLGQLLRQVGQSDEALVAFVAASSSSNDDVAAAASLNLGLIYEQRGQDSEATEQYEAAAHSGNENVAMTACRALGRLYARAGRHPAALSCLRRAAAANNPDTALAAQRDLELFLGIHGSSPRSAAVGDQEARLVPCRNGHTLPVSSRAAAPFCSVCGSRLVALCPRCNLPIEASDAGWASANNFCSGCSEPYPWAPIDAVLLYLRQRIEEEPLSDEDYDESLQLLAVLSAPSMASATETAKAQGRFRQMLPSLWRFAEPLAQKAVEQQLGLT